MSIRVTRYTLAMSDKAANDDVKDPFVVTMKKASSHWRCEVLDEPARVHR